jgi:hypothetical protein
MAERDARYVLAGQVQVDDAYLGGERSGGEAGRSRSGPWCRACRPAAFRP